MLLARKMVVTYVCLRCNVSSLSVVRPSLSLYEIKGRLMKK